MTTKKYIMKLVEAIEDEEELKLVQELVQGFAARSLNRKYMKERAEAQGKE